MSDNKKPSRLFELELLEERKLLAAPAITVGANVNMSQASGNQLEDSIAVNPTNSNNIVACSNIQTPNYNQIAVYRSFDSGQTWATTTVGNNLDGQNAASQRPDPRVAFDSFGNLYLVYEVGAPDNQIEVVLAQSSNGGASFTAHVAAGGTNFLADYPHIATGVDAANSKRQAIWIAFDSQTPDRVQVVVATSKGLGQLSSFSSPATVSSEADGNMASMAVGPSGQVAITWESPANTVGPANLLFSVNTAGSANVGAFTTEAVLASTNVGGLHPIPAQPDRTIDAEPILAYDDSNGPNSGRLYFIFLGAASATGAGAADTTLYLMYSDDNGATWSTPTQVNDGPNGHSIFNPALSVDPTTGYVGISWYDTRNSSNNTNVQYWGTISSDGENTFAPNFQISAGTSNSSDADSPTDPIGDLDFGDYSGLSFVNGEFVTAWADNSNSTGDNPNGTLNQFNSYSDVTMVDAGTPLASDDSYGTNEDTTLTVAAGAGVLSNDSAPFDQSMTAALVLGPANGTLIFDANGDGGFKYTPDRGFAGTDTFTYTATDINGEVSNVATVTLTVNAIAPTAANDSYSVSEDATLTIAASGMLSNDTAPAGESLTANVLTNTANGTLAYDSNGDGGFIYTPNAGYVGTDLFTYQAVDSNGLVSNVATVTLTVNAAVPVANDDSYSVIENATLTVAASGVLSNDSIPVGESASASVLTNPTNGTLTFDANGDGGFIYTPNTGYTGTDTFTYADTDTNGQISNTAMVTISVNAPIAPPGANAAGSSIAYGKNGTLYMTWYDTVAGQLDFASRNTNGNWSAVTSIATLLPGAMMGIAVDGNNNPGIAYYDPGASALKYAAYSNGAWTYTTVDATGRAGLYPDLIYTPSNTPVISYYDKATRSLKMAIIFKGKWALATVASGDDDGRYVNLHFNPQNNGYAVAFYDNTNGTVQYGWQFRSGWRFTTVDSTTGGAVYLSLNYDQNDNEAIAYYSAANRNLRYSWFNGVKWQTTTVISAINTGLYSTLLFDPNNDPDILYYNQTTDAVFRAQGTPGHWSISEVADDGGSYISASYAPDGTLSFDWLSDELDGLEVTDL